jgi:hypothetical protein
MYGIVLLVLAKLSINLSIYEFGPNDVEIEDVLYMEIQILNLLLSRVQFGSSRMSSG